MYRTAVADNLCLHYQPVHFTQQQGVCIAGVSVLMENNNLYLSKTSINKVLEVWNSKDLVSTLFWSKTQLLNLNEKNLHVEAHKICFGRLQLQTCYTLGDWQ